MISIVTGDVLQGSLPRAKMNDIGNEIDFCPDATRIAIETKKVEELAERYRSSRVAAE